MMFFIDARLRLALRLRCRFLSINLAFQILDGAALNLNLVVHLFAELHFRLKISDFFFHNLDLGCLVVLGFNFGHQVLKQLLKALLIVVIWHSRHDLLKQLANFAHDYLLLLNGSGNLGVSLLRQVLAD
jgi:hypothetical protein